MDGAFGGDLEAWESPRQALADLARAPAGMLALDVEDVILDLKGKPISIPIRTSAPVGEPVNAAFLVALEDLVPGLYERSRTPCTTPPSARQLVAELQTSAFRPSPNTPPTASHTSSQKGEKV